MLCAIAKGAQAMSVKVRKYRRGGWEVDITLRLPDGRKHRERTKAPIDSKSGAVRWGQDRERHLVQHGLPQPKKEVPTLKEFASRFIDGHALANQQKPSGIASKQTILRVHLVPALGDRKLDAIRNEDVQRFEVDIARQGPKNRQQRADGIECAVEEGGRMGSDGQAPLFDSAAACAQSGSRFS
jgi:hypothetical protein